MCILGGKTILYIFFYKSNYISSHRNCCKGHANAVNWNGNTNIFCSKHLCLPPQSPTFLNNMMKPSSYMKIKKWDLFWITLSSWGMLFFLLYWSKEICWPGIFYHPFSLLRQNGESADFWWFLAGLKVFCNSKVVGSQQHRCFEK